MFGCSRQRVAPIRLTSVFDTFPGRLCWIVQKSTLIVVALLAKRAAQPHLSSPLCATVLQGLIHHLGEDGLQIKLPEGLNERPVEDVRTLG